MEQKSEPLILAIDSCTRAGSVCLARGEKVLATAVGDPESSHSTDLIENVDRVLTEGESGLSDVDLFAATVGPGSFTGLRIGLATIKGFAVSTKKPCVGVSTLAAIAVGTGASSRIVCLLPAGRGEVYAQMFSVIDGMAQALDQPAHLSPVKLVERYRSLESITFAGEGTLRLAQALSEFAEKRGVLSSKSGGERKGWTIVAKTGPLANAVAKLALADFRRGATIPPDELRGDYVRPSDAEINEQWLQQNSSTPIEV